MRNPVGRGSSFLPVLALVLAGAGLVHGQQGTFIDARNAAALYGDPINSVYWDSMGSLSSDRLEVFITSDRHFFSDPEGMQEREISIYKVDLFHGTRENVAQPFAGFTNAGILERVNSEYDECTPFISADGLTLTWFSDRSGEIGQYDIWVARRPQVRDANGEYVPFEEPFQFTALVSPSIEWGQSFSRDMSTIYFSSDRAQGSGLFDLWQAALRADGACDEPVTTPFEQFVNSPFNEFRPMVSGDELAIFWSDLDIPPFRNGRDADIWMATRSVRTEPFGNVRSIGRPVNTTSHEFDFFITPDWPAEGAEIWFTSNRPGTAGLGDIWVATWADDKPFRRGDANNDGALNLTDGVVILGFLFLGSGELPCLDAADADDGGTVQVTDAVVLFNYLFRGEAAPVEPFGSCGSDPTTGDALHCPSFAPCDDRG